MVYGEACWIIRQAKDKRERDIKALDIKMKSLGSRCYYFFAGKKKWETDYQAQLKLIEKSFSDATKEAQIKIDRHRELALYKQVRDRMTESGVILVTPGAEFKQRPTYADDASTKQGVVNRFNSEYFEELRGYDPLPIKRLSHDPRLRVNHERAVAAYKPALAYGSGRQTGTPTRRDDGFDSLRDNMIQTQMYTSFSSPSTSYGCDNDRSSCSSSNHGSSGDSGSSSSSDSSSSSSCD